MQTSFLTSPMNTHFKRISLFLICLTLLTGCGTKPTTNVAPSTQENTSPQASAIPISEFPIPADALRNEDRVFGSSVSYEAKDVALNKAIGAEFSLDEIKNLSDMETAYGFTFTDAEKKFLSENKFVIKNLLDTSIRPNSGGNNVREFVQLYNIVKGTDFRGRGQQNSLFFSSDVFFHIYNNLFTELLKEMENKIFYPQMKSLSTTFYAEAQKKLDTAVSDTEKTKWTKIRNYFAVPYAVLSTAAEPLSPESYIGSDGAMLDPTTVMADFKTTDTKVDTIENVTTFIQKLKLDTMSEKAVLADLEVIYKAEDKSVPAIFEPEFKQYAKQENIEFKVDFTQFTPRSHYTSSSLRREYFRGMKWFIEIPFFVKSPALTDYAFGVTQLMAENPTELKDYSNMESTINFMVGGSDDLMPVDYMQALVSAKGSKDVTTAAMDYLIKARNPKIKSIPAGYSSVGTEKTEDVLLKTKGLRFFSGKFILDSYWTGQLTQGDEVIKAGYTQKLPPMASSLEVMALLGSDYARSQFDKLDFYTSKYSKAVDQAMTELAAEKAKLDKAYWESNLYNGWLATIQSLFTWQKENHSLLPSFMQSPMWDVKTLMTASAFWTELRHATLLYAKASFAELGGGGGICDPRDVPPAPKGYIEPQLEAYQRLTFLAKRTNAGLKEQGYDLNNMVPLENFVALMDKVNVYTEKELTNTKLNEEITSETRDDPEAPGKKCTEQFISEGSDWETLRLEIIQGLTDSIPVPLEGPILPAKDRRAALLTDVHTGGDSDNDTQILYEGEGVPYVIFSAVKDANGPRLTIGFTYSHYEFTKPYGGKRMTDEDWQTNYYKGDDPYNAYDYTDKSTWPAVNPWYLPMIKP
jgi:hypothetical protein